MKLKSILASLVFSLALGTAATAADVSVELSNIHLCCASCVKGVEKAIAPVTGASATADKDAGTVVITAADKATLQKAVDALVAVGYFATSNDPSIKVPTGAAVKDVTAKSFNVAGVHLCCNKCVSAVNTALKKVPGVTGTNAAKGVETFEVTGEFSTRAVIEALHEEGLSGRPAN